MADWYYISGDDPERLGSVTWEELQRLAASGTLHKDDTLWQSGDSSRVAAAQVPGLLSMWKPASDEPPPFPPNSPRTVFGNDPQCRERSARCGDTKLKDLAATDLKGGTSTDEVVRLGDVWWGFAGDKVGTDWKSSQRRAAYWYRKAGSGLQREQQQRLAILDRLPDGFDILTRRTKSLPSEEFCTVHNAHLSLEAQRTEKMPEKAGVLGTGVAGLQVKGVRFLELKVKASPELGGTKKNTFAGFMVDYQTAEGYSKRVALSIGPVNKDRAAKVPNWGKNDVPDDFADMGVKDSYQLDLQKWAPSGWTGQVWFGLVLQQRTPNTFLKAELVPRATEADKTKAGADAKPPVPAPENTVYLTGITPVDGQLLAWLRERRTNGSCKAYQGESFQFGSLKGVVVDIKEQEQAVVIEVDGTRQTLHMGDRVSEPLKSMTGRPNR